MRKVLFFKNMEIVARDDNMFQFLLMLEVFHSDGDQIYLLDYVQKIRCWRYVGFVSIYRELPANVLD